MVIKGQLSQEDYKLTCIACGSQQNIVLAPHRANNKVTGIFCFCEECFPKFASATLRTEWVTDVGEVALKMSCEFEKCPLYYPCLEMLDESPPCAIENSGTQPTDVQQLQAKIRGVADKLFVCHFQSGGGGLDNLALINELRELSGVQ